jgi:hypothetical protein
MKSNPLSNLLFLKSRLTSTLESQLAIKSALEKSIQVTKETIGVVDAIQEQVQIIDTDRATLKAENLEMKAFVFWDTEGDHSSLEDWLQSSGD